MNDINKQDTQSVLDGFDAKLCSYLIGQEALITQIENKLHKILNREILVSDLCENKNKQIRQNPFDFATQMSNHLNNMSRINGMLESVLIHISEII